MKKRIWIYWQLRKQRKKAHTILNCGVYQQSRAAEGVGCIIKDKFIEKVELWKFLSPRILKIRMQLDTTTIIVIHGPNEDAYRYNRSTKWQNHHIWRF